MYNSTLMYSGVYVIASATDKKDLDRDCGMNVTAIHSVYYNYLRVTHCYIMCSFGVYSLQVL